MKPRVVPLGLLLFAGGCEATSELSILPSSGPTPAPPSAAEPGTAAGVAFGELVQVADLMRSASAALIDEYMTEVPKEGASRRLNVVLRPTDKEAAAGIAGARVKLKALGESPGSPFSELKSAAATCLSAIEQLSESFAAFRSHLQARAFERDHFKQAAELHTDFLQSRARVSACLGEVDAQLDQIELSQIESELSASSDKRSARHLRRRVQLSAKQFVAAPKGTQQDVLLLALRKDIESLAAAAPGDRPSVVRYLAGARELHAIGREIVSSRDSRSDPSAQKAAERRLITAYNDLAALANELRLLGE